MKILAAFLLVAAASAQAAPMDAKGLARFDVGYSKCEQKFEHMRGHADEAYLGLWKIKVDERSRARLAALRKQAAYQKEKQAALKSMEKPSAEVDAKLDRQCQATWAAR